MGYEGGHIHRALKEKAKDILRKRGFSDSEIFSEYQIQFDENVKFRHDVDIAGIKADLKIAIEIGSTPKNRINNLKKIFDEVIHIPKSEYIPDDLKDVKYQDFVSKRKEFLKIAYNKYVFDFFKNDSVLEPKQDAPSYKFFYRVKGKMSVGRRPSLFSVLSNPKIEYNPC